MDSPLAQLTKERGNGEDQIHKIRDEKGIVTRDSKEIKRTSESPAHSCMQTRRKKHKWADLYNPPNRARKTRKP